MPGVVPGFEMLTRVGFAARGLMYVIIGYLSLRFGRAEGGSGALSYVAEGSGRILVAAMAVGFLAYGIWRLSEALVDTERHGTDAKGSVIRAGGAASGVIHIGLAFLGAALAFGHAGPDGSRAQRAATTALHWPGGAILLVTAAAVLIATGLWQMVRAVRADFLHHLEERAAHQAWIMWMGRAGYAARGIVFVITGWFFLQAGAYSKAAEAGGMEQVLGSLSSGLASAVALGLLLFGLFSLVESRFRHINDLNMPERLNDPARAGG